MREERENHASDPCPTKVNQSKQLSPPSFYTGGETALNAIRQYASGLISDRAREQTDYADNAAHLRHSSIDLAMSNNGGDGSSQLI